MTTDIHTLPTTEPPAALESPSTRLARGGGWWTLVLGLLMLLAMTEALDVAAWSEGLEVVRLAVLGGALLSFVLALTRWGGFFPALYGLLASLAWITTIFNRLIFPGLTNQETIRELVLRNINWLTALANGTASADNLIFITQLTLLGWWLGYLAIWSLVRHQRLLQAVIPTGCALLVNVYYSTNDLTGFLVLFLAAALLLAIRLELARNEVRWQLARVRYAPDITFDFLRAGLGFTVLVITLAWVLPSATDQLTVERLLRPFEGAWQSIEDTWNRMYKSLNYGTVVTPLTVFGKTTTLGGPVTLTDRPIFEAQSDESSYWRAAVYDTYTGAGWLNSDSENTVIARNQPLGEPFYARTREITATIWTLELGQLTIFAPPQPLRVSVPLDAEFSPVEGDNGARAVSFLRSRVGLGGDEPYLVTSAVSNASPDRLRTDGVDYPEWVTQRYLQLPETLPLRVRERAAEIVAGRDNPFDKAEALETALRTYTYSQQIAAPPQGADGVDYFLFDVQQGYCDYYASAMVVMLRAAGVPARFAVGYTSGQVVERERQPDPNLPDLYRVLERNAHAWPEVFFPSYGWVQFEPTASEPQLTRPKPEPSESADAGPAADDGRDARDRDDPIPDDFTPADGEAAGESVSRLEIWLLGNWGWLLGILLLSAAAWGAWWQTRARRMAFFRDREILAKLFNLLGLWAARLKVPWLASQTPLERAASFGATLPEATPVVDHIARLFVAQRYGHEQPGVETLASLAEKWRALQPALWRGWLMGKLASLGARWPRARQDAK